MSELALFGGPKAVAEEHEEMFHWPIVNREMEEAIIQVLRDGSMSETEITREFERKFAEWQGVKYAVAAPNGTCSLQEAMFALGVGPGTELICPSITYWASCMPAIALGARIVFADVDPETLCLDPQSFEAHITPKTKAVVVVHYMGVPADMDPILEIARKHNVKVLEDCSHAQGGIYKGRKVGTFGEVAAMSMMSGKSFAVGELGMLCTNSKEIYNKAVIYGHYERIYELTDFTLPPHAGYLPWGGCKHRANQMCSAIGLCQLKKYDAEIAEIDRAMKYASKKLAEIPGLHEVPLKYPDSTKAGWYAARMFYDTEAFGGLSVSRFVQALQAEGVPTAAGCNAPLHQSSFFSRLDIYGHGKPTACVYDESDPVAETGPLPVSDAINNRVFALPAFKHYRPEVIDPYIEAFRKVAANYKELIPGDTKEAVEGKYFQF